MVTWNDMSVTEIVFKLTLFGMFRVETDFHEISWSDGILQNFMKIKFHKYFHEISWNSIKFHDISWKPSGTFFIFKTSWNFMNFHELFLWNFMKLFMIFFHQTSWNFIKFHETFHHFMELFSPVLTWHAINQRHMSSYFMCSLIAHLDIHTHTHAHTHTHTLTHTYTHTHTHTHIHTHTHTQTYFTISPLSSHSNEET
jgi:hypothetical protein